MVRIVRRGSVFEEINSKIRRNFLRLLVKKVNFHAPFDLWDLNEKKITYCLYFFLVFRLSDERTEVERVALNSSKLPVCGAVDVDGNEKARIRCWTWHEVFYWQLCSPHCIILFQIRWRWRFCETIQICSVSRIRMRSRCEVCARNCTNCFVVMRSRIVNEVISLFHEVRAFQSGRLLRSRQMQ